MNGADSALSALSDTNTPEGQDTSLTALLRRRLGVLDDDEASGVLGLQPSTLQRWRVDGKGPSYIKVGNRILYRETDVMDWLARRVEEPAEMKFGR